MRCVFCGEKKTTKEHVWPRWIRQELPDIMDTNYTFQRGNDPPRVWKGPAASVTVRAVCAACNNGWMSKLETAAKPLLVRMIRGQRTPLDQPAQRTLAAWALKQAMMLDLLNPGSNQPGDTVISDSHYEHLRVHGEPPATTFVWITATDGKHQADTYYNGHAIELHLDPLDRPNEIAYVATFAIRHVAFQVLGTNLSGASWKHIGAAAAALGQIWPFREEFTWPPGHVLPAADVDGLAHHWDGNA
jgi:hypothetical protein